MGSILADVRYAFRVLARTPIFALAVVGVLALGIGANTATFSILNTALLRPLPYREPDRLVQLFHVPPPASFPGMTRFALSAANFYDWQRDARSFEGMALYRGRGFTLTGGDEPVLVVAGAVGAGFFDIVGTPPALGRTFRADEDRADARVVVASDAFWKSRLGGSPDAVGRTLSLSGETYTVVGVMPPSFTVASWFPASTQLWVPIGLTDAQRAIRENHNQAAVARLAPGVDVAAARAELSVVAERLERAYPQENAGWGATAVPLRETIVEDARTTLVMLMSAVALVLLIVCANVGNLLFTRALSRRKELAIRAALGAGRGRVLQQLLVEALVLSFAGGAAGVLVAEALLRTGATLLAGQVPRADEIGMDARVLMFALGASLLTGVLAGLVPALRAGRAALSDALKEGGRGDGALGVRTRRLLVVGEVALSVVLLMGAAVMLRSVLAMRTVDAGYDPRGVLTMRVGLPDKRYPTNAQRAAFFDAAAARLRALPGVRAAGAVDNLPLEGGSVQPIVVEGRPELLPRDQPTVQVRALMPGYLQAMGIPLLRGRDVGGDDVDVLLVSRAAAKMLWGDADPVGRRVTLPLQSRTQVHQVVGVVGDVKQRGLAEVPLPTVYPYTRERAQTLFTFVMRASVPAASLSPAAVGAIRALDPQLPVVAVRTMDEVRDEQITSQRFGALLLGAFALLALVLATVGIYSVLSYVVRGRTREIGIRSALGARTGDVLRMVVREGMKPAFAGVAAGCVAALAASVLLQRLAFGVSASDPLTLAGVCGTLALVALLACLVPAYRATRIDPAVALRD
jgi:putative ABC transport system permease protein